MTRWTNLLLLTAVLASTVSRGQDWSKTAKLDTILDKNGQIRSIENRDNFEDIIFAYDSTGKLSRTNFTTIKNGKQYEKTTEYFTNGKISRQYFNYILDKKLYGKPQMDSLYTEYYENGTLKTKSFFIKGKQNGQAFYYYQDGKLEAQTNYVDDKLMNVKYFDNKGNQLDTGEFKDGNGKLIMYKDGGQISICRYKNGKLLRRTCKCN